MTRDELRVRDLERLVASQRHVESAMLLGWLFLMGAAFIVGLLVGLTWR